MVAAGITFTQLNDFLGQFTLPKAQSPLPNEFFGGGRNAAGNVAMKAFASELLSSLPAGASAL